MKTDTLSQRQRNSMRDSTQAGLRSQPSVERSTDKRPTSQPVSILHGHEGQVTDTAADTFGQFLVGDERRSSPGLTGPGTRVLILSDAEPDRNGVGSYYADLVVQLREHVDSAALFHPGNQASPGYRYLSAPLPGDSTQRVSIPRPTHLWRAINQFRPTVIIVPTPGPFGLAGLLIARKLGIPMIVGFHTHYEALATLYWQNRFGFICQRYLNWCNRLLFRHGAAVLANSPDMLRQAMNGGARMANLMGTSVPDEFLRQPTQPLNAQVKGVLFAGRLADEKNLPQVLEAARQHPQVRFTIAGEGPLRPIVEKAARELTNLEYLGWVSRAELLTLMDRHEVLLLPSRVESFGTVALEGMARGRLVIVTATCGIAEWPQLAEALCIVADDETPSHTLRRLMAQTPDSRQSLASRAREQAVNLNSWNIRSWVDTLQRVQSGAVSSELDTLAA